MKKKILTLILIGFQVYSTQIPIYNNLNQDYKINLKFDGAGDKTVCIPGKSFVNVDIVQPLIGLNLVGYATDYPISFIPEAGNFTPETAQEEVKKILAPWRDGGQVISFKGTTAYIPIERKPGRLYLPSENEEIKASNTFIEIKSNYDFLFNNFNTETFGGGVLPNHTLPGVSFKIVHRGIGIYFYYESFIPDQPKPDLVEKGQCRGKDFDNISQEEKDDILLHSPFVTTSELVKHFPYTCNLKYNSIAGESSADYKAKDKDKCFPCDNLPIINENKYNCAEYISEIDSLNEKCKKYCSAFANYDHEDEGPSYKSCILGCKEAYEKAHTPI